MQIDPATGWLDAARRALSPNRDDRPVGVVVDLIVIHGISLPPGEFGGPWIDALFANTLDPAAHPYFQNLTGLRVSAHLLIRRDGDWSSMFPFRIGLGTPANRFTRVAAAVMISASASNWKALIISLTTSGNIRSWQRRSGRCGRRIRPLLQID